MANRSRSNYPDIGILGEDLVAQWLRSTGWVILHRRWRCRWGEIDIVARFEPVERQGVIGSSPLLAFVEVKTRSRGNWDAGGLLSITSQKRTKLWQTARCFLAAYPKMAEHTCRFDVALVCCQKSTKQGQLSDEPTTVLPIQVSAEYQLILQDYIPSAFDQGN